MFKSWIRHDFINYKNIKKATQEVERFKENKLGTKFRILEIKIIKK